MLDLLPRNWTLYLLRGRNCSMQVQAMEKHD